MSYILFIVRLLILICNICHRVFQRPEMEIAHWQMLAFDLKSPKLNDYSNIRSMMGWCSNNTQSVVVGTLKLSFFILILKKNGWIKYLHIYKTKNLSTPKFHSHSSFRWNLHNFFFHFPQWNLNIRIYVAFASQPANGFHINKLNYLSHCQPRSFLSCLEPHANRNNGGKGTSNLSS